ncbi:unnamed protein product [Phaeothamnion confervicola]
MVDYAIQTDPKIGFLLKAIKDLGCDLPDDFIACKPCDGMTIESSGGFSYAKEAHAAAGKPQVVMCQDKLLNQRMCTQTINHELIHAFDQCRAKADWSNCLHHACTEIRASNMSGECSFRDEFNRSNFGLAAQQQACVKRRAALSLQGNSACAEKAAEYVEAAFEACYRDTAPYDRNP